MDDDVTMVDEWKFPTCLNEAFPPDAIGENVSEGSKAGFEKQGLSVTVSSPQEEGRSLPVTPQFGQKFNASSSLAERMAARAGFTVAKLSMPCQQPSTVVNPSSGALSPYLTIPPGLSPTTLLESPVFLSNAMSQASPTTGKLFSLDGTIDTDPNRMEGSPFEDGPDAFSFKPSLEFKSSQFPTEAKKDSFPTDQHSSLPSTGISVKTEAIIQTAQDTNVLNQRQFNGQAALKSSSDECKLNNRQAANTITGNHNSPPDQEDGDGKGDYSALATVTPAEDGYSWRKYGQKQVKHSEYPRSYYKCTHPNCQVKKKVERSHEGHITEIIYKGTHSHPKPAQSRRPGAPSVSPFGDAQMDASDNPASQANVEARSLWHNNGVGQEWRGDGVEVTSSPSVPGELCGSTAMQVQDGCRFESPEGLDDTSPLSDEVDGDDRVTHGSVAQGTDGEIDELESKRRKLESCAIEMSAASRAVREPRVVIQTTSDVDILDDGYRWRKYGQKVVKGNPNPRSYYKCTHPGCSVRKHVERASHDLKSVITTYEGKHNHEVPAARNSGHPSSASGTATASPSQAHTAVRRPEPPAAQDGMVRLSSCAAPLSAFGLPPRDPLAPMSNFPYSLGQPGLSSLPMPVGLGAAAEGLKLPMFVPPMQPFLRHRPGIEAGFMIPKGEVKEEAAPEAGMLMPANGGGAAAAASVYQQMMSRLPLGPQM